VGLRFTTVLHYCNVASRVLLRHFWFTFHSQLLHTHGYTTIQLFFNTELHVSTETGHNQVHSDSSHVLLLPIVSTVNDEIVDNINVNGSRGSSVSIVSGYGLVDRAIEVRSLAGAKDFTVASVPRLLSNGYRGSFPGSKARQGRDADHSPPYSAEVVNE
jgi:hypothetical protein